MTNQDSIETSVRSGIPDDEIAVAEEQSFDYPFRLGEWLVQPDRNLITNGNDERKLEPRVMQLLISLASQSGIVIKKDDLILRVWGDIAITDNTLAQAITSLRRSLEDDWRNPRFIETISKVGYSMIQMPEALSGAPTPVGLEPIASESTETKDYLLWSTLGVVVALAALFFLLSDHSATVPAESADLHRPLPLTSFPGNENSPVLSPDGQRIAYAWQGDNGVNWDIYVQPVGLPGPVRLTTSPQLDFSPAWSPDGRFVAYIRQTPPGCLILQIPSTGGTETRMAECRDSGSLDWSPDGNALAFDEIAESGPNYLRILDISTGQITALTYPPAGVWGDIEPKFSPDGTMVAFRRIQSEHLQDLFVVPLDGGDPIRLTEESQMIRGLDWTPDGSELIISWRRTGRWELWRVPVDGGAARTLPVADSHMTRPDISGDRLVYSRFISDVNIWRVLLGSDYAPASNPKSVLSSTRHDLHPQISPDGHDLVFVSDRSGRFQIWRSAPDGSRAVQLTHFESAWVSSPKWTPDSQTLVFDARIDGQTDLYSIHAQGGSVRRLTTESSAEVTPSISRDGQTIYFASNREEGWQIWRIPITGGAADRITPAGGYSAQEGLDSESLFLTKYDQPGVWKLSLSDLQESLVTSSLRPMDWGSWQLAPDGILFVARQPQRISFYDFASHQTRTLVQPGKPIPSDDPAVSISSDGSLLFFTQIERAESDVMMLEGF